MAATSSLLRGAVRVIALTAILSAPAHAQRTGAIFKSHALMEKLRGLPSDSAARQDTIFALLVFDPSLVGFARLSAWTASVVPVGSAKEARIQANLCDLAVNLCGDAGAFAVTLAGPLSTTDEFTRLADLDGLVGSARVELSFTTQNTHEGFFLSASGSYSQPSFAYRDSSTLGRHSVDHAEYAAAAGAGYRWSRAALLGSFRVEQAYAARASQSVCVPSAFGPAGTETCATIILAPPASKPASVASATFAWSLGGNAAAHFTVSRDVRNSVTGIDMPVWVLNDPKSGVGAGVRFGYTSDAKKMTVAFFVSTFKL